MYEVLNIRSLKQATPNLRVINLWGVSFVDDSHIEAFSSNCIQLAVLCVNYCPKVQVSNFCFLYFSPNLYFNRVAVSRSYCSAASISLA